MGVAGPIRERRAEAALEKLEAGTLSSIPYVADLFIVLALKGLCRQEPNCLGESRAAVLPKSVHVWRRGSRT